MNEKLNLSLSDLDAADESHMTVMANGREIGWTWTLAGPGHPQTIAQSNRLSRDRLRRDQEQEQARVNGKKWKAPDERPDDVLARNVDMVVERLLGWSEIEFDGAPYPFTPENARSLLMDRRKNGLLIQSLEFLGDEVNFSKRSPSN